MFAWFLVPSKLQIYRITILLLLNCFMLCNFTKTKLLSEFLIIRLYRKTKTTNIKSNIKMASSSKSSKKKTYSPEDFLKHVAASRGSEGSSIQDFKFEKTRVRILSEAQEVKQDAKGIIYWMNRDCRVQDNWAFLFSQKLALKNKLPLHVCIFLKDSGKIFTERHLKFFIEGLREIEDECRDLDINFNVFNAKPEELCKIVADNNIGAVVCEFNPLRKQLFWQDLIKKELPDDIPFVQVDSHNVVPVWIASDKQESMARTLRIKVVKILPKYLTGFPCLAKHQNKGEQLSSLLKIKVDDIQEHFPVEGNVEGVTWAIGGTKAGLEILRTFLNDRLELYGIVHNDPSKKATSNLSPWINFGHVSAQRIALEVKAFKSVYETQTAIYLEELIVRRELTDNFCYYNQHYDSIKGANEWAQQTLKEHSKDKRQYLYTRNELEKAETHDIIWNAAQIQLLRDGKMHNYMRMYWCKKILEWTKSPEEAIEISLYLNDTYSLDGSDPNGFVGVMWSICGIHDQGWKERPVFGKIRYMVDYSLRRKYDIDSYIARYVEDKLPEKNSSKKKGTDKVQKGKKRKHSK